MVMKSLTVLLATTVLLAAIGASNAAVRIVDDPGGRIGTYIDRYEGMRSLAARRSSAADAQNIGLLAASANASDYAVDVGIFLIKDLPRIRLGNIGCDWLVVTYGR
jgi:hypothetical protein